MPDFDEKQVIADVQAGVPAGIAKDVLDSNDRQYGTFEYISLVTPAYQKWLSVWDPSRKKALAESVREFRAQRENFYRGVSAIFDSWVDNRFKCPAALFNELYATGKYLYIRPFHVYHPDQMNADTGPLGSDGKLGSELSEAEATEKGKDVLDASGGKGNVKPSKGLGLGTDVIIEFSPWMFPANEDLGPATQADETLFHEMVHASRIMRGVSFNCPVNQGYDTEEEYLAVVLTNIFMSEKGKTVLRARHKLPNIPLRQPEKFLDNIQGVSMPPKELMRRFKNGTLNFYREYAAIDTATFNPVAEYLKKYDTPKAASQAAGVRSSQVR